MLFVSPEDLKRIINKNEIQIIDLRDKASFNEYHLQNAINVPYELIEKGDYIPDGSLVQIYCCDRGNLSLKTTVKYRRKGYNCYSLAGGVDAVKEFLRNVQQ